ncbi:MAG: hypothetical protein AAF360_00600 [Pseudomonadota bacterium]
MFKRITAAALVFGMAALAPPVHAQQTRAAAACADRDTVVAKLAKTFKEDRVAAGLQSESAVLEIWVSDDTGAWTITRTGVNGVTCIMAAGQAWTDIAKKLGAAS